MEHEIAAELHASKVESEMEPATTPVKVKAPVWLALSEQVSMALVPFAVLAGRVLVVGELPGLALCVKLLLEAVRAATLLVLGEGDAVCDISANTPTPPTMTSAAMTAMIHFGAATLLPALALYVPRPLRCCTGTSCLVRV